MSLPIKPGPVITKDELPLLSFQSQAVYKWPCDGKPRFAIKGSRHRGIPVTYSEAYDAVLRDTGCVVEDRDGRKHTTFTPLAIKRIGALNEYYCMVAKDFIVAYQLEEQRKIKAEIARAQADAEKNLPSKSAIAEQQKPRLVPTGRSEGQIVAVDDKALPPDEIYKKVKADLDRQQPPEVLTQDKVPGALGPTGSNMEAYPQTFPGASGTVLEGATGR